MPLVLPAHLFVRWSRVLRGRAACGKSRYRGHLLVICWSCAGRVVRAAVCAPPLWLSGCVSLRARLALRAHAVPWDARSRPLRRALSRHDAHDNAEERRCLCSAMAQPARRAGKERPRLARIIHWRSHECALYGVILNSLAPTPESSRRLGASVSVLGMGDRRSQEAHALRVARADSGQVPALTWIKRYSRNACAERNIVPPACFFAIQSGLMRAIVMSTCRHVKYASAERLRRRSEQAHARACWLPRDIECDLCM